MTGPQLIDELVGQLLDEVVKGGPGSGFHGHAGRPGEVGGSAPDKAAALNETALRLYGATKDPRKASFILSDGRLVAQTGDEHEAMAAHILNPDAPDWEHPNNLTNFLDESGAIRINVFKHPNQAAMELSHSPTRAQQLVMLRLGARIYTYDMHIPGPLAELGDHGETRDVDQMLSHMVRFYRSLATKAPGNHGHPGRPPHRGGAGPHTAVTRIRNRIRHALAEARRAVVGEKWDEAQHPREPPGSPEGGQFTAAPHGQLAAPDTAGARPGGPAPSPGPSGTRPVATRPVPLAWLNDPSAQQTLDAIYGRTGTLEPGTDTMQALKIYDLHALVADPAPTQAMLDDLGLRVDYFAFENDPAAGVTFKVPDLKRNGYAQGTLWIYNPAVAHGSFEDTEYTRQWRIYHEAGHAIAESLIAAKYGPSKREGRLGVAMQGVRGDPARGTVAVPLRPLTLREAQRAIEWEDVAFRTQRVLLQDYGHVQVPERDFAREFNVNISDAAFRVLTGDFGDPGHYGYRPAETRVSTRDMLTWMQNQEHEIARTEGRKPTAGIDLTTWKPISDQQIRDAIRQRRLSVRKWAVLGSVDAIVAGLLARVLKGGPGSGFFGHAGRPGQVGGSLPEAGAATIARLRTAPVDVSHARELDKGHHRNPVYVAQIDGEDVIVKPDVPDSQQVLRWGVVPGNDNGREIASLIVNDWLGGVVQMPRVATRDLGGLSIAGGPPIHGAMIEEFKPGAPIGAAGFREIDQATLNRLAFFDATIANLDRHGGNALRGAQGVSSIDHGLSFPDTNDWLSGLSWAIDVRLQRGQKALSSDELGRLDRLLRNRQTITDQLTPYLRTKEIDTFWQRVWTMRSSRLLFDRIYPDHVHHTTGFQHLPIVAPEPVRVAASDIRSLVLLDAFNHPLGTITVTPAGAIEATGLGTDAAALSVVEPDTLKWLRPTDGQRWLDALRFEYRSAYVRALYADELPVQRFDEAQHPREPAGSPEGGQFTTAPDQALHAAFEAARTRGEALAAQVGTAYGGILPVLNQELRARGMSAGAIEQYSTMLDDWTQGFEAGVESLRAMAHMMFGGDVYSPGGLQVRTEAQIRNVAMHPRTSKPGSMSPVELATAMGIHAGITQALLRHQQGDTVLLYRGYRPPSFSHAQGDTFSVTHSALSSYSSAEHVARAFGTSTPKTMGVVLEMRVPVRNIFANYGDVGDGGEFENLVMGGTTVQAKVLRVQEIVHPRPQKRDVLHIDADPVNRDWLKELRKEQKWDEAQHPREPAGTPTGGQFTVAPGAPGAPLELPAPAAPPPALSILEKLKTQPLHDVEAFETPVGHTNTTLLAKIGDEQVVLKPEFGSEDHGYYASIPPDSPFERQVAAYDVNEALGGLVQMPAVVVRDFGDEQFEGQRLGRTLVTEFIPGEPVGGSGDEGRDAAEEGWGQVAQTQIDRMGLFDAVIANLDRHPFQAMINEDGNLVAIDHDRTFPEYNPPADPDHSVNIDAINRRSPALSAAEITRLTDFQAKRLVVNKQLAADGLYADPVRAMWDRVDWMVTHKRIYPLDPENVPEASGTGTSGTFNPDAHGPSSSVFQRPTGPKRWVPALGPGSRGGSSPRHPPTPIPPRSVTPSGQRSFPVPGLQRPNRQLSLSKQLAQWRQAEIAAAQARQALSKPKATSFPSVGGGHYSTWPKRKTAGGGLVFLDIHNTVIGTLDLDATGRVRATGIGRVVPTIAILAPDGSGTLTPADGQRWLDAVPGAFRDAYVRARPAATIKWQETEHPRHPGALGEIADILLDAPADKWDESQHPRAPAGSAEGGQFTAGAMSVNVTSVRPETPKTPAQVWQDVETLRTALQKAGVEVVDMQPAHGGWQGETEASVALRLRGPDEKVLPILARQARDWNQDGVLVSRVAPGDPQAEPRYTWDFGRSLSPHEVAQLERQAQDAGFTGWTIEERTGRMHVQTIPDVESRQATMERAGRFTAQLAGRARVSIRPVRIMLLDRKDQYGGWTTKSARILTVRADAAGGVGRGASGPPGRGGGGGPGRGWDPLGDLLAALETTILASFGLKYEEAQHPRAPAGTPTGGQWVSAIPADQIGALQEEARKAGFSTGETAAVVQSAQRFANTIDAVDRRDKWRIQSQSWGPDTHGLTWKVLGTKAGGATCDLELAFDPGEHALKVYGVGVPATMQHHGFGQKTAEIVRDAALGTHAGAVTFFAVSGSGLVGGYVWARLGAQFSDEHELKTWREQYELWLSDKTGDTHSREVELFKTPQDFVSHTVDGRPLGKMFLTTEHVSFHARIPIAR